MDPARTGNGIDQHGSSIYHGPSLGLELFWGGHRYDFWPDDTGGGSLDWLGARSDWYAAIEALWLKRDRPAQVLIDTNTDIGGTDHLTTDQVDFGFAAGPRVSIGRHLDDRTSIELGYFGLQDWGEVAAAVDSTVEGSLLGLYAATIEPEMSVLSYDSRLHNVEMSLVRQLRWGPLGSAAVSAGLRYVDVGEQAVIDSVLGGTVVEQTAVCTSNRILGAQMGGELTRRLGERVSVGARGKAGLHMNFTEQSMTNWASSTPLNVNISDVGVAGNVDLGVSLRLDLTDNIALLGGYQLIYLRGLALATEQLPMIGLDLYNDEVNANTGNGINEHGSTIYHGPSAGIEVRWGGG